MDAVESSVRGVLCDKRIPIRLQDKFYKAVARTLILYGSECCAAGRKIEHRISVREDRNVKLTMHNFLFFI